MRSSSCPWPRGEAKGDPGHGSARIALVHAAHTSNTSTSTLRARAPANACALACVRRPHAACAHQRPKQLRSTGPALPAARLASTAASFCRCRTARSMATIQRTKAPRSVLANAWAAASCSLHCASSAAAVTAARQACQARRLAQAPWKLWHTTRWLWRRTCQARPRIGRAATVGHYPWGNT